jgi:hypothetical protein
MAEARTNGVVTNGAERTKWLNGWASAVYQRLLKMAEWGDDEVTRGNGTALVVQNKKSEAVAEKFGDTKAKEKKASIDMEGYDAGMKTSINMNRPLESNSKENACLPSGVKG